VIEQTSQPDQCSPSVIECALIDGLIRAAVESPTGSSDPTVRALAAGIAKLYGPTEILRRSPCPA
jgi:hypothetical protein